MTVIDRTRTLLYVGGPRDGHRTVAWPMDRTADGAVVCTQTGGTRSWSDYRLNRSAGQLVFVGPCVDDHECEARPHPRANYDCVVMLRADQAGHPGPHRSCMGDTWYDGDPVNPATGRPGDIPPDHRDAVVAQYGRYGLAALRRADRRYAAIRRASRWPKLTAMHRTYHHRARTRKGKR